MSTAKGRRRTTLWAWDSMLCWPHFDDMVCWWLVQLSGLVKARIVGYNFGSADGCCTGRIGWAVRNAVEQREKTAMTTRIGVGTVVSCGSLARTYFFLLGKSHAK